MLVRTKVLNGNALNWAAAVAEGLEIRFNEAGAIEVLVVGESDHDGQSNWVVWDVLNNLQQFGEMAFNNRISIINCEDDSRLIRNEDGTSNRVSSEVWFADYGGYHSMSESYGGQGDFYGESFSISDDEGCYGDTAMIAGARCYVTKKLGREIDVPDNLIQEIEQKSTLKP